MQNHCSLICVQLKLSRFMGISIERESGVQINELIKVGGKQQVPCLFIDSVPMYESDEIVAWLKENPEK